MCSDGALDDGHLGDIVRYWMDGCCRGVPGQLDRGHISMVEGAKTREVLMTALEACALNAEGGG